MKKMDVVVSAEMVWAIWTEKRTQRGNFSSTWAVEGLGPVRISCSWGQAPTATILNLKKPLTRKACGV